ncbi:MAG: type II secretion system protein, partial [bacterium]
MKTKRDIQTPLPPASCILHPRAAFTLVELLVVITIIGILASLITVAAVSALRKARETEIKAEIDQVSTAIEEYKNKTTAYPPNCQTDGTS